MAAYEDPYFSGGDPKELEDGKKSGHHPTGQHRRTMWWVRASFFGFLVLGLLFVLGVTSMAILFHLDTASVTKVISSKDAMVSVSKFLIHYQLTVPSSEPTGGQKAVVDRILGGRGFTESGGLNGDGIDWYEADLSPEFAADLRRNLTKSALLKPSSFFPIPSQFAPDWWPTTWPPGSACYEVRLIYLVLPPSGTRIWVQVLRN